MQFFHVIQPFGEQGEGKILVTLTLNNTNALWFGMETLNLIDWWLCQGYTFCSLSENLPRFCHLIKPLQNWFI